MRDFFVLGTGKESASWFQDSKSRPPGKRRRGPQVVRFGNARPRQLARFASERLQCLSFGTVPNAFDA
jgi:hypothetical protein